MLMVNLASVLLARAAQREHEFAVSRALGANNVALSRATLLEGGLLGLAGGALGALAAVWGTRALLALAPLDLPRREAIAIDWGIAAPSSSESARCSACLPRWCPRAGRRARRCRRCSRASAVRGGGGHGRMRRGHDRRAGGVVARAACRRRARGAQLGAICCGADPGFKPDGVFTVRVTGLRPCSFRRTPSSGLPGSESSARWRRMPGVTGVGAASALPLTSTTTFGQATIRIPGAPGNTGDDGHDTVLADVIGARAGYFEVMGMRIVAGRTFERSRPPASARRSSTRLSPGGSFPAATRSARRFRSAPTSR